MGREVSSYFLRAVLEAGELFGKRRDEMIALLPDPLVAEQRWGQVDWADFLRVFRAAVAPAGSGEELIAAGRRYMRERHGTRTAYLYGQFLSWDKVLWVARNFMAPRLIRGYTIDYEKLGPDHFRIVMRIPETLEGDPDFFYYLTGLWTGSSRTANLRHEIDSLEVSPHCATAEVRLGKRSSRSRILHNPLLSRLLTRKDIRGNRSELRRRRKALERANADLEAVLEEATDLVWLAGEEDVRWANAAARRALGPDGGIREPLLTWADRAARGMAATRFSAGGRSFRLRDARRLEGGRGRLFTITDETDRIAIERNADQTTEKVRHEALALFTDSLESRLDELGRELTLAEEATDPDSPIRADLGEMKQFANLCRRHGAVLIGHTECLFKSADEFHAALSELARNFEAIFRFRVAVTGDGMPVPPETDALRELFLICQEGIRNAWRHSGGSRVEVRFHTAGLAILDDGHGLEEDRSPDRGVGLRSLRHRADSLGMGVRPADSPLNGWIFETRKEAGGR